MTGPLAALQAQHDLARWWKTPAARQYARSFDASVSRSAGADQAVPVRYTVTQMPDREPEMLATAPTYSVTPDMVTVVEAAAQSFPGQALHAEDLPSPTGFVTFDRSIMLLDTHGKEVEFAAFSWEPADIERVDKDGVKIGGDGPGIFLAMYSSTDDVFRYHNVSPKERAAALTIMGASGYVLLHVHGIVFGYDYELSAIPILQNHLAFIEALFAIMQQRIVIVPRWTAPRGFRRNVERQTGHAPDVRIVTLRQARYRDAPDPDGPGYVEWSHRWLVSGHWRRIWSEARHEMRLVWISPYIKGPEDKPLVVKDTVHNLSR